MKPIVIYVGEEKNVKLSREEFEKYLNEAYKAGYDAGYANAYRPYWWTSTTPNVQPLRTTWVTGTQLTCNGDTDSNSTLAINSIGDLNEKT